MQHFNALFKSLIENNTVAAVLGRDSGSYADGDARPIEPAKIVLGAKVKKQSKRKAASIPIQRRYKIETILK